jgi:transposase
MEKKLFIGIDFSKKTFDVSMLHRRNPGAVTHRQFENTREGCANLLKWVKEQGKEGKEAWMFCGEHTGLYSLQLSEFLIKKGLFMWLENPMQIKRSTGLKRDKTDKLDSRDIALYAFRYQDKAKRYQLPEAALQSLELLLSFRERLLKNKHALSVSAKEIRAVMKRNITAHYIYEQSQRDIERTNSEIHDIEAKMLKLIHQEETLNENYTLVSSIKGIALINTVAILVTTRNFSRFDNSRQFACYTGMAPFGRQSGTSIRAKPRVSHIADKKLKVLLTQAAKSAVQYDPNIREYYQRKLAEGKKNWLVMNNIRNKLIHRIFALVRTKQLYQTAHINPMDKIRA